MRTRPRPLQACAAAAQCLGVAAGAAGVAGLLQPFPVTPLARVGGDVGVGVLVRTEPSVFVRGSAEPSLRSMLVSSPAGSRAGAGRSQPPVSSNNEAHRVDGERRGERSRK